MAHCTFAAHLHVRSVVKEKGRQAQIRQDGANHHADTSGCWSHLNAPRTIGHYRTLSTTVTEVGPCPAGKGEPGTGVNAPDALFTTKPETLFPGAGPMSFTTYRNVPERSKLSEYGPNTPVTGKPASGLSFPVDLFRPKARISRGLPLPT